MTGDNQAWIDRILIFTGSAADADMRIVAGKQVFGTTWDSDYVSMGGETQLRQAPNTVLHIVDEFSNDYLSVNPSPC